MNIKLQTLLIAFRIEIKTEVILASHSYIGYFTVGRACMLLSLVVLFHRFARSGIFRAVKINLIIYCHSMVFSCFSSYTHEHEALSFR